MNPTDRSLLFWSRWSYVEVFPCPLRDMLEDLRVHVVNSPQKGLIAHWKSVDQSLTLRQELPDVTRRFVVAHNLGHILCGHEPPPEKWGHFNMNHAQKIEQEANQVALNILVPNWAWRVGDDAQLARYFGVNEAVIQAKRLMIEKMKS